MTRGLHHAEPGHEDLRDPTTRSFMESRFGHDFRHVRIYADARAAESAQALKARAYTLGRDIVFGTGEYRPENPRIKCRIKCQRKSEVA